ncbi:TatD family hydrolase [Yunchengibacter salinarum]|uniref:TatD family hydrolase n=1 Tax=Yunchengibacter salinarum TaxID=3133399 RepID=UPI0035B6349B
MSTPDYIVDSHCHLNYDGLKDQEAAVVERARTAGVGCMLAINTKLAQYDEILGLTERYDDVFGTVGVHPHEAANEPDIPLDALLGRAEPRKIVGIGETGLDYYYDNAPRTLQQTNFRTHMAASRETGLPLIVHTRDADEDCVRILREESARGAFPGVIHCFTATRWLAEAALDLGFYISISGIVTFKNAKDLQEIVRDLPLDRLLVETDSPFLAPVPHRGKKCEPAFVVDTARFIADLKGIPFEELRARTTENFFTLFNRITPPEGAGQAA